MHFSKNANKLNRTFLIYEKFDQIPVNDYLYTKFDKEFNRQLYQNGKCLNRIYKHTNYYFAIRENFVFLLDQRYDLVLQRIQQKKKASGHKRANYRLRCKEQRDKKAQLAQRSRGSHQIAAPR